MAEKFPSSSPEPSSEHPEHPEKLRAVIVDTGEEALETRARDIADARMNRDKDELRGVGGFFKKIWTHNLLREYYRQREVGRARQELVESGNLYNEEGAEAQAHQNAMDAIVTRFTADYEEVVHKEAGEERRVIDGSENEGEKATKARVQELIHQFARGEINEEAFQEEKIRIFNEITGNTRRGAAEGGMLYADNLLEIAQEVQKKLSHEAGLKALDIDLDLVIGKAKAGVRTEANFNRVDRIINWLNRTSVGRLVNETTLASAVSIGYSVTIGLSERVARSKVAAWGSFGATAALGGIIAGARESERLEEERREHARQRAEGKEFEAGAKRREQMEKFRYETRSARDLAESVETVLYIKTPDNRLELRKDISEEDAQKAMAALSDIEARIRVSDRDQIDLIHYSSAAKVEEERTRLDLLRARAKVDLRRVAASGGNADEDLRKETETTIDLLTRGEGGINERNRLFKSMKRKRVAARALAGIATGLAVGTVAQEGVALLRGDQEGVIEHLMGRHPQGETVRHTMLRGLLGPDYVPVSGKFHEEVVNNIRVKLPEGVDIRATGKTFELVRGDEVLAKDIIFNPDGSISEGSKSALEAAGISAEDVKSQVEKPVTKTTTRTVEDYIEEHDEMFRKIKRDLWYGNDTPAPVFDKNELRLDLSGPDEFSVARMTADGSYQTLGGKFLSADAKRLAAEGKLKMLFTLSKTAQTKVIEVPIGPDFKAHLTPELKKLLIGEAGGKLKSLAKYAEVGEILGEKEGVARVRVLATAVGEGIGPITETITTTTTETAHLNVFDVPPAKIEGLVEPPPVIPVLGRTPLERMKAAENEMAYYLYGGAGIPENLKKEFEARRSKTLKENPEAKLDHYKEIKEYLKGLSPEYRKQVEALAKQAGEMSGENRLTICIPAAGHQEGKNIYQSLENFTHQSADPREYEIVVFVNHPDKDKKGKEIKPDETINEIRRFQKDHPEVPVRMMYSVIPLKEANIGHVRKLLNDAVLVRQHERGRGAPDLIMVSNDADNKGVSPEYVKNFIRKFDENPDKEGFLGQLDWDPEAYVEHPTVHIGTRLFQYLNIIGRRRSGGLSSSGANFAFRSSMYAGIGGYMENSPGGEDIRLGQAIIAARSGRKESLGFAGAQVSRLYTSARRAIDAWKRGLAPIEQWDKFSAFDDAIRKMTLEKGKEVDYADPEVQKRLKEGLEHVINRTLDQYLGEDYPDKNAPNFRKVLGLLGIKYELDKKGNLVITDMSSLVAGLQNYKEYAVAQRDMKSGKPGAKERLKEIREGQGGAESRESPEFLFRQKRMLKNSVPSPTLKNNPDATLDPRVEVEEYFKRADAEYLTQLETLNEQIKDPMHPDTKAVVCIPVAGHQETSNVYATIRSFANQKGDLNQFEVLLLVNAPARFQETKHVEIEKTRAEIERAKQDFPNLRVATAYAVLPDDQVRIANIRKIVTDLALLRGQRAGVARDLILLSNDADNQGVSEGYIESYVSYFESHPEKDGAVGNLQFDPKAWIRFPGVQIGEEIATRLDQTGFENGNAMLFGANSAMKSSIYAGIGGYPPGTKVAEQEWTGNAIRAFRKKNESLGFVREAVLATSSRRGLATEILKAEKQIAFGDEKAEETMRGIRLESFPPFDWTNDRAVEDLRKDLEERINESLNAYDKGERLGKDAWFYTNNLGKIGIIYRVQGNPKDPASTIEITDMSGFISRQKEMQKLIEQGETNMARVYEATLSI